MGTGTGVDRVLDKPFIVVEGFDAWRITEPDDPKKNFDFEDFINGTDPGEINISIDPTTGQTLNDAIEDEGYDLVFVDFDNGTDYIERNAYLVENIIQWVNAQKPTGADDNVVLGMSMGGLVARFALRDMEMDSVDHQTRLYISHDAPHQGANVPVAAQAAVTHLASTSIGLGVGVAGAGLFYNISFADLNQDLDRAAQLLREPATRQLVQYTVTRGGFREDLTYDNSLHDSFMETYRSMGLPQDPDIRNVAIASGSECAVGQELGPYATLLDVNDGNTLNYLVGLTASVLSPFTSLASLYSGGILTTKSRLRLDVELNALPDRQSQPIYRGRIYIRRTVAFTIKINTEITNESLNSLASMLPLDSSPGGVFDINEFGDLPDEVVGIPLEFETNRFNFVPTTSALDIGQDGRAITVADLNARYSPGTPTDTEFDNYFTNPVANEEHIQFTLDNGQWMLNEMQESPTVFSCVYACVGTTTGVAVTGPTTVCDSAIFEVTNTAGQPINWTVSNNLSIVAGQGSTILQIAQSDTDGPGWVEVTVGSGTCEVTERINVATGTTVPPPTGITQSGSGNTYLLSLINAQPGVSYTWEVFGEEPVITRGQGTSSITVEFGPDCANTVASVQVSFADGCEGTTTISQTIDGVCSNFAIFPNPADEQFTVALNGTTATGGTSGAQQLLATSVSADEFEVVLYDQQQQVVQRASSEGGQLALNVRSLKPGVYVLHIVYQGKTHPYEVMIE